MDSWECVNKSITEVEKLLTVFGTSNVTKYQGEKIPIRTLLEQHLPPVLGDILQAAWTHQLPVAVAGSFAAFSQGVVSGFNDIDIFCTAPVLR